MNAPLLVRDRPLRGPARRLLSPVLPVTVLIASCTHNSHAPVGTTETTAAGAPALHQMASATQILTESVADDGRKIPIEAAARSSCVAVVPNAFRNGELPAAQQVSGIVTCRTNGGGWSQPGFFILTAGPTARPVDPRATDLVILTQDENAEGVFANERVGQAASPAAPRATLISYAHRAGAFSGAEIGAVHIRPDRPSIRSYYRDDRPMGRILAERADATGLPYPATVARSFDHAHAVFFPDGK